MKISPKGICKLNLPGMRAIFLRNRNALVNALEEFSSILAS